MPGLIGKKVGMTSVFSAEGKSIPCTVIEAGPCVVTQVKTIEKDGYTAIQLGFDDKKEKNTTKPLSGHFKKAGTTPKRKLVEFSGYDVEYKLGDVIDVNLFEGTEYVDVVGTSKGKGFQGVVKRHGFAGVGEAALGVFFHLVDDFFEDFFLRTDFEPRNQPSFVVHVEQRADTEEAADCAGGFGDAAAAHVEGEVRGEEPVMDFEAVFHRKIVNLFQRFSFIAQVGKAVHQKTIAGGSTEGIHDEDFPFRVALFKVGFGDHRGIQYTGNAGGEADVENVFAVLQECFKIGFKFIGIHLGCFRGSAGGHGGIELIERHGFAEIIRVLGVI